LIHYSSLHDALPIFAIPVAILYVKGIAAIVKKAGTATSNLSHSICCKDFDIITPTIINAGAVTSTVIIDNKGEKNKASKKNPAVKIGRASCREREKIKKVTSTV